MRKRRRRTKYPVKLIVVALMIILIGSSGLIVMDDGLWSAEAAGSDTSYKTIDRWLRWKDVLFMGIPGMKEIAEPAPVVIDKSVTADDMLRKVVLFFFNVDTTDMRSWLRIEIPMLAMVQQSYTVTSASGMQKAPIFEAKPIAPGQQPLVAIYHTHTAESFLPTSGVTHRPGGQRGEIVEIGEAFVKRLEMRGIKAMQSKTIHDYPSFMKAYGPAEETVKSMLTQHPSIQMVFDIHRDADKRENAIIEIDGVTVARIALVVAKGQPDLMQPHWQSNYAFAKQIDAKLNQYFPGLSRGIQLVDWRYNQHLHPQALLLEVGCQENSKEEAARSIEMLADVIAEMIELNK